MAKNIRSEYIKQLIEDKNSLENKLSEVTKETIKSIIDENVGDKLRQIISEDEDSFIEDEVEDDSTTSSEEDGDDAATDAETETEVDDTAENGDETTDVDVEDTVTDTVDDGTEDSDIDATEDDVWNDLEQYKGEDGEYDLTGMDADNLIKVMQVMKPTDGIRVVKNDNGTITLSDDETEKEYIIDIDAEGEDGLGDFDSEEGVEESKKHCNEGANLGYTDDFQNKTAMTTPPNNEPANPKTTYSMDGGAPTGTEKRWANQGSKAPYDEDVNEECEYEVEIDDDKKEDEVNETMTTQEQGPYNRGDGMVHTNTNSKAAKGRNAHAGGKQVSGTGDNSYSNTQLENIMRKANAIFNENKELKALVPKMQQQMMESIVINKSMGNVMRIVMENSTTLNEKKDILKRFTGVKTIEESDSLYQTISEELKREGKTMNVNNVINSQLAESKNSVVETPMYQSEDLSKTLDLINRLNKIK